MKHVIILIALLCAAAVMAQDIPPEIKSMLSSAKGIGAKNEIMASGETKRMIEDFLTSQRDDIVPLILKLGPENILAENLARAVAGFSEPRDYLIIVTEFLNRVADGDFPVEKDKWIIFTFLGPNDDQLEGLLAMNYQLPELNEALRRALPKIGEQKEFVQRVLSGEDKKQTIEFFEAQDLPLPIVFSSLHADGRKPSERGREANTFQTSQGKDRRHATAKANSERMDTKQSWWIIGSAILILLFALLFALRKSKRK